MLCNNADVRRCSYFELGLPVMIIRSNALQQTGKQCSSFSSVVLVCVTNSELPLEYCHIIFQRLGFIRIEQCFTLGLEIEIISFVLSTHGLKKSLRQSLLRRKKLQGGRVRTFSLPLIFITLCLRIFHF